jgi:membrane fusion protein, multidrug efflux system
MTYREFKGLWMRRLFTVCFVFAFAVILAACSSSDSTKATVKPPVAVDVQVVAAGELLDSVEVTGNLEPKFSVDIKTQIPGLIKHVYVNEWVRVRKGQPLARIEVAETEAQVKRAQAGIESARAGQAQSRVTHNKAERELGRMLKLKEAGLATQQALDDARSEVDAAKAKTASALAQLSVAEEELRQAQARLAKGNVNSPIDGIVALRDVNVGDLASDAAAGKPIFRIVDNRLLNLTFSVSSADSARIKQGQALEFTVDSQPGKTFSGVIKYINPELSSADRSMKVIAEVRNDNEQLKGGLFAKGRIIAGKRSSVLQVPRSAVNSLDLTAKKGSLFVIENGVAKKRDIVIGVQNGERIEVVSGLKAGEHYVVRGGFNLKDGDQVAVPQAAAK